jgi:1-deoxy-D-xylulose-5-phosphate synthase
LRFVSPIDWTTIDGLLAAHSLVVISEDGYRDGGVGEAVAARVSVGGYVCAVRSLGVESKYIAHATRAEQLIDQGLTGESIASVVGDFYGETVTGEVG